MDKELWLKLLKGQKVVPVKDTQAAVTKPGKVARKTRVTRKKA